jgi:hypothetical protein
MIECKRGRPDSDASDQECAMDEQMQAAIERRRVEDDVVRVTAAWFAARENAARANVNAPIRFQKALGVYQARMGEAIGAEEITRPKERPSA